jgi:hypothetical protein
MCWSTIRSLRPYARDGAAVNYLAFTRTIVVRSVADSVYGWDVEAAQLARVTQPYTDALVLVPLDPDRVREDIANSVIDGAIDPMPFRNGFISASPATLAEYISDTSVFSPGMALTLTRISEPPLLLEQRLSAGTLRPVTEDRSVPAVDGSPATEGAADEDDQAGADQEAGSGGRAVAWGPVTVLATLLAAVGGVAILAKKQNFDRRGSG